MIKDLNNRPNQDNIDSMLLDELATMTLEEIAWLIIDLSSELDELRQEHVDEL